MAVYLSTFSKSVDQLEAGDVYLWGEVGQTSRTVREVLGVIARSPMGILLEVRRQDGNVTRSLLGGHVDCIKAHPKENDQWMVTPADGDYLAPGDRWCRVCTLPNGHRVHAAHGEVS